MRFVLIFMIFVSALISVADDELSEELMKGSTREVKAKIIFSVSKMGDKGEHYRLQQFSSGNFLLEKSVKSDEWIERKIASSTAESLDQEFVGHFVKISYSDEIFPKNCRVLYELTMRSEQHQICDQDKKSIKIIEDLQMKLEEYFKN